MFLKVIIKVPLVKGLGHILDQSNLVLNISLSLY